MGHGVGVLVHQTGKEVVNTGHTPYANPEPFLSKEFVASVPFPTIGLGGGSSFNGNYFGAATGSQLPRTVLHVPESVTLAKQVAHTVPLQVRGLGRKWLVNSKYWLKYFKGNPGYITPPPLAIHRTPHG
jgi:hypothetical protein